MPLIAARKDSRPTGRLAVLGFEPAHRQALTATMRELGYGVVHEDEHGSRARQGEEWAEIDAVLILAEERDTRWAARAKKIVIEEEAPPVVVLGSASGPTWRRRALEAGAFVCGSREAPAEELQSIVSAALRYRALVKDNNLLRVECERICMGLLRSYGEVATSLKDTTEEVEVLQRNLRDIRNQIIRAFV